VLKQSLFLAYLWVILSLTGTSVSHAHAVVTKSTLQIAPLFPGQDRRISLQFNAQIELGLSRIFLVSAGDKLTPLNIFQGKKPGEVVIDVPALSRGEYALKLQVFATDGHLTEDILRFTVRP
jgi:methionine-rich copper-binding protein CopC